MVMMRNKLRYLKDVLTYKCMFTLVSYDTNGNETSFKCIDTREVEETVERLRANALKYFLVSIYKNGKEITSQREIGDLLEVH